MHVEEFNLVTVAIRYLADEHNIKKKTSGLMLKAFPMDFFVQFLLFKRAREALFDVSTDT